MKKAIYTIGLLAIAGTLNAQGILGRIKSKVVSVVDNSANSQAVTASGDGKYTDPAKFGKVLMTFSAKRMQDSPDGYNLWFPSVKVVNNQLELKIADYNIAMYSYSGGNFQKTGEIPDLNMQNKIPNGAEIDSMSVDFSQIDANNSMLKKGPHVASGMIPGKPTQNFTFNGKVFATLMYGQIAHNADSSVVAIFGAEINKGLNYCLLTSAGQRIDFAKKNGGLPLISPNGKVSAALFQGGGMGGTVVLTNGTTYTIHGVNNTGIWLRNNGSVFYFANTDNSLTLERNGVLYHKFEQHTDPKMVFISSDDKTMCWYGSYGFYFSDGTVFENAQSPHRVRINNKDVIIFLVPELRTGKVYLCQHDL